MALKETHLVFLGLQDPATTEQSQEKDAINQSMKQSMRRIKPQGTGVCGSVVEALSGMHKALRSIHSTASSPHR